MKPITIAIYELKKKMIESINNSGLPAEVVKYVVLDIANSVSELASRQLQEDLAKETKKDAED
jgi:hypothetical protein